MSKSFVYVEDGHAYPADLLNLAGVRDLQAKERVMDTMYEDLRALCENQARKIKLQAALLDIAQVALTLAADELERQLDEEEYDEFEDDDGA